MHSHTRGLQKAAPYLQAVLGAAILSFGLYNVHSQSGVTEGGVLGMTLLIKHWLGISPAFTGFVLDAICYLVGFRFLGTSFAKYSLVSSVSFALFYRAFEQFPPLFPGIGELPLLAAVLGALFVGVGAGLVVRTGGACGGDDALALSIAHVTHWPIARAYLFTDLTVLALSLTYIPFSRIFYSLITVTLSSFLIGRIQNLSFLKGPAPKQQARL
jgi:uncharacterized membrane-anchored protein YitT (DUF2179 family)